MRDSDELHDHRHMFVQCNLTVLMCVTRRSHVTDRSYLAFLLNSVQTPTALSPEGTPYLPGGSMLRRFQFSAPRSEHSHLHLG